MSYAGRVSVALCWAAVLNCVGVTSTLPDAVAAGGNSDEAWRALEQGDYKKASSLLRPLAEAGDPEAQANYGALILEGLAGRSDPVEACKWFQRAADQGYAHGQDLFGECYYRGQGVPKEWSKAVEWYRKAAEQGDAGAQNNLGAMYSQGEGVAADTTEAVKWFERAALQGQPQAMHNLSKIYYDGRPDLPKDYRAAYKWTILACAKGYQPACMFPRALEDEVTIRQLYEATKELREWGELHPDAMKRVQIGPRPK